MIKNGISHCTVTSNAHTFHLASPLNFLKNGITLHTLAETVLFTSCSIWDIFPKAGHAYLRTACPTH